MKTEAEIYATNGGKAPESDQEWVEWGRRLAQRYSSPCQIDGRPMSNLEGVALIRFQRADGNAFVDRLITILDQEDPNARSDRQPPEREEAR